MTDIPERPITPEEAKKVTDSGVLDRIPPDAQGNWASCGDLGHVRIHQGRPVAVYVPDETVPQPRDQ